MMLMVVPALRATVMRSTHLPPTVHRSPVPPTTRGLLSAFLLLAAFPVALYALDHPLALVAVTVVGVLALALRAALTARRRRSLRRTATGTRADA